MAIGHIHFYGKKDQEAITIINRIAELEQRKVHDAARRFVLQYGPRCIAELEAKIKGSQLAG